MAMVPNVWLWYLMYGYGTKCMAMVPNVWLWYIMYGYSTLYGSITQCMPVEFCLIALIALWITQVLR